ncbi:MAG: PadR family transcriptional regulator [Anaerolineae bacterium]|nr:PadR family transcriptional regulator [Anaerolineae bacterium]
MSRPFKRSPLALAILALLYEAPMHPYMMQRLIKGRAKDEVINVERRASLYQTIRQLERAGLIAVKETQREEKRPERTVYALTDAGRDTLVDWMRDGLATPAREFPEFPAMLSFIAALPADEARQQLETRAAALSQQIARIDKALRNAYWVPRVFLLEMEYLRTVLEAELGWVRALVDDMRRGDVTWDPDMLRTFAPPSSDEP